MVSASQREVVLASESEEVQEDLEEEAKAVQGQYLLAPPARLLLLQSPA